MPVKPVTARVAVLGAGVAGLVAAHELAQADVAVDVYERWPGLGGQAATLDVGGDVLLERYYHHLFTSDRDIQELYEELGMPEGIEWLPSSVGFFCDGANHPFTTPLDLLRFRPLPLHSRLRMGLAVVNLQLRHPTHEPFERITASAWIRRSMGRAAWDRMWGPLLRGKFGDRAEDVSMAWLWARFKVRRQVKGGEARGETLGYPRGSFEGLFRALAASIEERGGRVLIDRPAAHVGRHEGRLAVNAGSPGSFRRGHDPRAFEQRTEPELYDAVLATVPNGVFERLLDPALTREVGEPYLDKLRSVEYHAALCLLLEVDRQVTPFYWTNVADSELPFIGLVEQTNFTPPERFGGRRFLYVANYLAHGDPLLELSPDELLSVYEPGLRRVNRAFTRDWVRRMWMFREPDAQPIVTVSYGERIPPLATPAPGLMLANTTQVYPEDRGTNYAVELGRRAARTLMGGAGDAGRRQPA